MANYWEEKQREDREVIRQILQEQGIGTEDITLIEGWCVFPYKGFWITLKIESALEAEIFRFPEGEEGTRLAELLKSPNLENDTKRYNRVVKFREGYQARQEGGRHKVILSILKLTKDLPKKK